MESVEQNIKEIGKISKVAIKNLNKAKKKHLSSKISKIDSNKFKDALTKFKTETKEKINQNAKALTDQRKSVTNLAMEDRALVDTMFKEYCNALFYNSFKKCDDSIQPQPEDTINEVLSKINSAKMSMIEEGGFPLRIRPSRFKNRKIFVKDQSPIRLLLKDKVALINLKDHFPEKLWLKRQRWRISSLHVQLLDKDNQTLKSGDDTFGGEVETLITFPDEFIDIGTDNKQYRFKTDYDYYCKSTYITNNAGQMETVQNCQVDTEFAEDSFKPSLNGLFNFTIISPPVNFEELAAMRIIFSGSHIDRNFRRRSRFRKSKRNKKGHPMRKKYSKRH